MSKSDTISKAEQIKAIRDVIDTCFWRSLNRSQKDFLASLMERNENATTEILAHLCFKHNQSRTLDLRPN